MAAAHERGEFGLREGAEHLDVLHRETRKDGADVLLNRTDDTEALARMTQTSKGFEQVGNSLAQADGARAKRTSKVSVEGSAVGWKLSRRTP